MALTDSPDGPLAVCKILSRDEVLEMASAARKPELARKQAIETANEAKEVRLSLVISEHDLQTKMRRVGEWIGGGKPVRLAVKYRPTRHLPPGAADPMEAKAREMLALLVKREDLGLGAAVKVLQSGSRGRNEYCSLIAARN